MIKANELRIGNWVRNVNYQTKPIRQVTQLWADVEFEELQPIPLTPEILEKAGFDKFNKHWNGGRKVNLTINENMEVILTELLSVKLDYLHQLQNLFFALTGEELKINL